MTLDFLQLINKKQDTAGNWTLSQQSQECHHRSLLLFCCCCKGKSKTWRNKTDVCSSRKRKPLHTRLLHYPVTTRGFLGREAETRRWDILFPHSPAFPTALNWYIMISTIFFIHIKRHDTSIPGDTQSLFFLCNSAGLADQKGQCRLFLVYFAAATEKDKQFKPPRPPSHMNPRKPILNQIDKNSCQHDRLPQQAQQLLPQLLFRSDAQFFKVLKIVL